MNRDFDYIDPALGLRLQLVELLRMTNDGLVAFNQASGLAGTQLVPDLAEFASPARRRREDLHVHLRPGIHYSDGRPVKASDVRATFERDFGSGLPVPEYYEGIVGAKHCANDPTHCDLSKGIVTDDADGTVTFHLVGPDPEFLDKLALPFAYVAAGGNTRDSPTDGTRPRAGTGPYRIADDTTREDPHASSATRSSTNGRKPPSRPDTRTGSSSTSAARPTRRCTAVFDGKADAFELRRCRRTPRRRGC